jgi:UPF0042 nucleotide-binding protein
MLTIFSFGYGHGEPPAAEITLDLRRHFRDPHIDPALKNLTAYDESVRKAVRNTPGIMELVTATAAAVEAYLAGPSAADLPLRVAVGCVGGRHRAGSVAEELWAALSVRGHDVRIEHRDLDRPVIER